MSTKKPIHSMTGFGRGTRSCGAVNLSVECKSLNSRFLEVSCKVPRVHSPYEAELRQIAQSYVSRGRLELMVSRKIDATVHSNSETEAGKLNENESNSESLTEMRRQFLELVSRYSSLGIIIDNQQRFEIARQLVVGGTLKHHEDVLVESELTALKEAVIMALEELQKQRREEGQRLLLDLSERLVTMAKDVEALIVRAAENPLLLRERVSERIKSSIDSIVVDESRLMQEIVLLIDKSDVTEELVRLRAHLELFNDTVISGGLVGKKLDFICQEIFRELNTLGGKSASAQMQAIVVNSKVELERIREQVQNFE